MEEEIIAAVIALGALAAVFLPLGICPLVYYFKLTRGLTVTAMVAEHVYSTDRNSHSEGRVSHSWLLKMKYYVNGKEYVNTYSVCKKRAYLDAHPVGTEIKILVNIHNPKKFILPEDKWILMVMGGMFTLGGIASLIGMIDLLLK